MVELAYVLKDLWRLRLWIVVTIPLCLVVALSTGYKVSYFPPKLEPKTLEVGTAATQVLVDSPQSALLDTGLRIESLATRAQVFASLIDSQVLRTEIARAAGITPGVVATDGPSAIQQPNNEREQNQRSAELVAEGVRYRVSARPRVQLPLINIATQAPSAEEAVLLANGAAEGLSDYVNSLQTRDNVPRDRRVEVRQLGEARGGLLNEGASKNTVGLTFIGLVLGSSIFVVLVANLIRTLRGPDDLEADVGDENPTPSSNGTGGLEPSDLGSVPPPLAPR